MLGSSKRIDFKSILHKGAVFVALFELLSLAEARADDAIDIGPVTTPFNWEIALPPQGGEFDTELNGLPAWGPGTFTQYLGPIKSVAFTFSGTFDWPNPQAGNFIGTATETINFTMLLGNYIPGQPNLLKSFPVAATCQNGACPSVSLNEVSSNFSFPTVNGAAIQGATVPINLTSSFSGTQGGAFIGGPIFFTGKAVTDITYNPLTPSQYVQESLDFNRGTGGANPRGFKVAGFLSELRGLNAATSSTNLNLRDAEYAAYGYNDGSLLASGNLAGLIALGTKSGTGFGGPIATLGWNTVKVLAQNGCGPCQQLLSFTGTGLPGTPANLNAGLQANTVGFLNGLANPDDINGLPAALASGLEVLLANQPPVLQPVTSSSFGSSGTNTISLFVFDSTAGNSILVDPTLAKAFAFGAAGANFSGIELPSVPGTQDVSSALLTVDGKSVTIMGNTWYDFADLFGADPNMIMISDLTGGELPQDPEFAFRFDASGLVVLSDVETNSLGQAVPEIPTWLMAAAGFAVLALAGGGARRSAATLRH
jgi:hypothetical protein